MYETTEMKESVQRLSRDLAEAAATLGPDEARFMVDAYYMMQDQRKRFANQLLSLTLLGEPHDVLPWFMNQSRTLENQCKRALGKFAEAHPVGERILTVVGIGPVITAGLLAHIDMEPWCCTKSFKEKDRCTEKEPHEGLGCGLHRTETAGQIWRFAGVDPTSKWGKGERRPWNASLKTLCWKIGESFVKQKGREGCFYGQLYDQRKAYETEKNERLEYADQAAAILKAKPTHKQADTYATGKLPKSHIHERSKRYAVKLFLAHLHEIWYWHEFGKSPPLPYPIAHLGHAHKVEPPF